PRRVPGELALGRTHSQELHTFDPAPSKAGSLHCARPIERRSDVFFGYLWKELRRRRRQAIVVSLGLALGIGLVVSVSAMATGVRSAQASVLHSLYGVGTDVTVTKPAARGVPPPGGGFRIGSTTGGGTAISRDRIVDSAGDASFPSAEATRIAHLS